MTHEGDQGDSEFTNLLNNTLCSAIVPGCDDPVLNPLDVEDTTNCLQEVTYEKRELSCEFNEPSKWWPKKTVRQTM